MNVTSVCCRCGKPATHVSGGDLGYCCFCHARYFLDARLGECCEKNRVRHFLRQLSYAATVRRLRLKELYELQKQPIHVGAIYDAIG